MMTLGEFAPGDVVKIREDGALQEFYVAQHGYGFQSKFTLLARRGVGYSNYWVNPPASGKLDFLSSYIHSWLNSVYIMYLPQWVQMQIPSADVSCLRFFSSSGSGSSGSGSWHVASVKCKVFLLSASELGYLDAEHEGYSLLPAVADLLRKGRNVGGAAVSQFTRSVITAEPFTVWGCNSNGVFIRSAAAIMNYVRPVFRLPSDLSVNNDGELVEPEHRCFVSLAKALPAAEMPVAVRLALSGSFPDDAVWSVHACNNGFDEVPVWEDVKPAVVNGCECGCGCNYVFRNSVKSAADWGVNFFVSLMRGPSGAGGFLSSVSGAFRCGGVDGAGGAWVAPGGGDQEGEGETPGGSSDVAVIQALADAAAASAALSADYAQQAAVSEGNAAASAGLAADNKLYGGSVWFAACADAGSKASKSVYIWNFPDVDNKYWFPVVTVRFVHNNVADKLSLTVIGQRQKPDLFVEYTGAKTGDICYYGMEVDPSLLIARDHVFQWDGKYWNWLDYPVAKALDVVPFGVRNMHYVSDPPVDGNLAHADFDLSDYSLRVGNAFLVLVPMDIKFTVSNVSLSNMMMIDFEIIINMINASHDVAWWDGITWLGGEKPVIGAGKCGLVTMRVLPDGRFVGNLACEW